MSRLLAPRYWAGHLLALAAVAVAVGLGLWQYDAWGARRAAEARDLTTLDPVPLASVLGPDDPFPGTLTGQPVVLEGSWLPDETVFVSGRRNGDRTGFWAVTPLDVGDAALLVVRGWAPSPEAAPEPPEGGAELVAWLQPAEGTGAVDTDPGDDVLPQLRVADVLQRVDQDLYGGYAVVADRVAPGPWPHGDAATNDGTAGLAPASLDELPRVDRFTALRNLLYAIEWWVFGLFAAFIWWRWVQDEVARDTRVHSTA